MVVQEQTFYHINRAGDSHWKPGARFFFGNDTNNFVSMFDLLAHTVSHPVSGVEYPMNMVADEVLGVLGQGKPKARELASFYHYDPLQTLSETNRALHHALRLIREYVFEEVRRQTFPEHPSRHRCIWLVPNEEGALHYWWKVLGIENSRVFQVRATGKVHRASQKNLSLGTFSLQEWRQNAFKYWAGVQERNTIEDEVLFEGFVHVEREMDPASLAG